MRKLVLCQDCKHYDEEYDDGDYCEFHEAPLEVNVEYPGYMESYMNDPCEGFKEIKGEE